MSNIPRVIAATSLVACLTASGALSAAAVADTVTRTFYSATGTGVSTTLCSFPVTITSTQTGYLIDHTLSSGGETLMFHGTETDVFSANGKMLPGLPYTGNIQLTTDAQGNPVRFAGEGIVERVPLPDGQFFTAGRVDFLNHLDRPDPIVNPDFGHVDNVAELCAALA